MANLKEDRIMNKNEPNHPSLPACVTEYLDLVIKKMGYRRRIRREVRQELTDHFVDALAEVPPEKQEKTAQNLIAAFGDAKLLATLIRRGKKRCRPWWKKAMIRSIQTAGLSVVLLILYAFWFAHGQPTISTDYVSQLNQLAQPQITDEQNAWPYYERAIQSFVPPEENLLDLLLKDFCFPDSDTFSPEERHMLSQWIQRNQPTWQQLQMGSIQPYCYRKYSKEQIQDSLYSLSLDHLKPLRGICRMGVWQARFAAAEQRPVEAIEMLLTVARVGKHWHREGLMLIEQLVGVSINHSAFNEVPALLQSQVLTGPQLKEFQAALEQLYPQRYPLTDFQAEYLLQEDTFQCCFTRGGPGGGHIIPPKSFKGFEVLKQIYPDFAFVDYIKYAGSLLVHVGRDETLAKARYLHNQRTKDSQLTPYERHQAGFDWDKTMEALRRRYLILQIITPASGRAADMSYRGKAMYEATITLVALQRWQLDKGQYPERLDELVADGYLKQVPMDPYSEGPLRYQRRGDDFTLYSVGEDFIDDGGTRNEKAEWGDSPEKGGGDKVFWPLP